MQSSGNLNRQTGSDAMQPASACQLGTTCTLAPCPVAFECMPDVSGHEWHACDVVVMSKQAEMKVKAGEMHAAA